MSVVGERIRRIMLEKHVTQNGLARRAQLSQSGLSSIINGAVSPKEETVRAIARALDVSPSCLLDESAPISPVESRQEGKRILDELPEETYQTVLLMLKGLVRP